MNNVVVICLDSVRKDVFDEHATVLPRLADASLPQVRAPSCWSVPSHASMLTGHLPHHHGASTYHRRFDGLNGETVLEKLEGHTRYGVSANMFASSEYGFDRFFDEFVEVSPRCRFGKGRDPLEDTSSDRTAIAEAAAFLRAALTDDHPIYSLSNGIVGAIRKATLKFGISDPFDEGARPALRQASKLITGGEEPSVTFVNLMDAHTPLRRHRGMEDVDDVSASWSSLDWDLWDIMGDDHDTYWETRRALYAAAIRYLDREVAQFVEQVQAKTNRETVVIITADHGENLGYPEEDFLANHTSSLSEGLLHVPFVVCTENGTDVEMPDSDFVSLTSLPEVVQGAGCGSIPDVSHDRVVAEVLGRGPTPEPPANENYWDRTIRCAYEDTTKVVWDSLGDCTRYRLNRERPCWQEVVEEESEPPSWADEYFATSIDAHSGSGSSTTEPAPGTKQRLKELGYL